MNLLNIFIMLYGNLLLTLYLYVWIYNFHFNISEEVCVHIKAYTLDKTLLVLKVSLDSDFVLLFQTNMAIHLKLFARDTSQENMMSPIVCLSKNNNK